jgi:hypothetical protein
MPSCRFEPLYTLFFGMTLIVHTCLKNQPVDPEQRRVRVQDDALGRRELGQVTNCQAEGEPDLDKQVSRMVSVPGLGTELMPR